MDLKIRDNDIKKAEEEMVQEFCDRNTAAMIRKSPEEIIKMWLDYQYARFKVRDDANNNIYILYDFQKYEPVMIISRHIPGAYHCVHDMCDKLNDMDEEEFIEHENRVDFKDFFDLLNGIYNGGQDD